MCHWPGFTHNATIFVNSSISENLKGGTFPITYKCISNEYEKIPSYLIDDPAYPLAPTCMKEVNSCQIIKLYLIPCLGLQAISLNVPLLV